MVEDNVIKLELKRVRDALYKTSDGVISLEKDKMQMETAMKERREEIRIHVEMLRQQMKAADAERHTINAELHDRISRIDKLKKRFSPLACFSSFYTRFCWNFPLSSDRQHLIYDDCLEVRGEIIRTVLCCIVY